MASKRRCPRWLLPRSSWAGVTLLLISTAASAQVPDLSLPGNLPGQLTEFGVGLRDAIRKKLGSCYRPVDGSVLVCGHRPSYRIDRNVFEATRNSSGGSGSEYDRYVEARARHGSDD
jgi:hypothetical protein